MKWVSDWGMMPCSQMLGNYKFFLTKCHPHLSLRKILRDTRRHSDPDATIA